VTPRPVNPPPVQSLWVGERLSPIEQLCVSSFLHHGHEFHLYAYGELAGVPAGAALKDAGYDKHQSLPAQSLLGRLNARYR